MSFLCNATASSNGSSSSNAKESTVSQTQIKQVPLQRAS